MHGREKVTYTSYNTQVNSSTEVTWSWLSHKQLKTYLQDWAAIQECSDSFCLFSQDVAN